MAFFFKDNHGADYIKLNIAEEVDTVRKIGDLSESSDLSDRDADILSDIIERFIMSGSSIRLKQFGNLLGMLDQRNITTIDLTDDGSFDKAFGWKAAERRRRIFNEHTKKVPARSAETPTECEDIFV